MAGFEHAVARLADAVAGERAGPTHIEFRRRAARGDYSRDAAAARLGVRAVVTGTMSALAAKAAAGWQAEMDRIRDEARHRSNAR
jgi:hypothetical protein